MMRAGRVIPLIPCSAPRGRSLVFPPIPFRRWNRELTFKRDCFRGGSRMTKESKTASNKQTDHSFAHQAMEYWVDSWLRTILFWDVFGSGETLIFAARKCRRPTSALRGRMVLDVDPWHPPQFTGGAHQGAGRRRHRPEEDGPFVRVDPRAGHGAGIGDSRPTAKSGWQYEPVIHAISSGLPRTRHRDKRSKTSCEPRRCSWRR